LTYLKANSLLFISISVLLLQFIPYDRALAYYNMELDIKIRVFGPNNLEGAQTFYCIGNVYFEKGNLKSALEFLGKIWKLLSM
jgi:tetratricopeptide (TPR) repeat protein